MTQNIFANGLNDADLCDIIIENKTCIYFCISCGSTNIKYNKSIKMSWLGYLVCYDCGSKYVSNYIFPVKLPAVDNVYDSRYVRKDYFIQEARSE